MRYSFHVDMELSADEAEVMEKLPDVFSDLYRDAIADDIKDILTKANAKVAQKEAAFDGTTFTVRAV